MCCDISISSMTQKNAHIDDTYDSCSNITEDSDSDDINIRCGAVETHHANNGPQIKLNLPNVAETLTKPSVSYISSVSLQNSTDITFGNKTLYSGPITVNQFGVEHLGETTESLSKRWKVLSTIFIVVSVLASVAVLLVLYFTIGEAETAVNIDNDNTDLTIITREQWRAKNATGEIDDLKTPVPLVIIQHTVQFSCNTLNSCATLVRQAQTQHINSPSIQDDIGYNFLVGGDGAVYEGRGWDKVGAHTMGFNSRSIGVGFIGDYRTEEPTDQEIIALLKLLRIGVNLKKISENYTLLGANQVQQTESPGKHLYAILTKLPHWSDQVYLFE